MREGASLRARLVVAMSVLLLLVLGLAAVGVGSLARLARTTADTLAELVEIGDLTTALTQAVHAQVREAELHVVAPGEVRARRLVTLSDSVHGLRRALQRWAGFAPDDHTLLNRVEQRLSGSEVAWATAHVRGAMGATANAQRAVVAARAATDTLLIEVQRVVELQRARATHRADELNTESARRRNVLWFLFATSLLVGVISIGVTVRAVNQPLSRLAGALQRFGGGDLRAADLSGMPAELASLGSAMNLMAARLRQLTVAIGAESSAIGLSAADLSAMSQQLAASSGEISEAMVRLAEGAGGQIRAVQEADQQLAALRDTGRDTLRAARRVTSVGRALAAMAQEHRRDVQQAAATLLALRETVRSTAAESREAVHLSEALTALVDRERQLATKVGVLAVNSSIEAARAGEQGSGMTAVAEELRLLETACETTAEQAEGAVHLLQERIRTTAATLDHGSTAVLGVEATAGRAASALEEIAQGIAGMQEEAERVVRNAEAARAGIAAMLERTEAVARAAAEHAGTSESVSAATEEQAAATEEMAAAAARLDDAARRLESLITEFRT